MNEWLFVNSPVKTDAVFVSAVWVRYGGKESNKQSERSVSQHFPFSPLRLPKMMPQLLLKCNRAVYFHATYHAYLKSNIHAREVEEKWVQRERRTGTFWCNQLQQRDKSKIDRKQHIFRNLVILESRPPYGS